MNPRQIDPTRTVTLRKAFVADFNRRWNVVRKQSQAALLAGGFGPNGRYGGFTSQQQAIGFCRWLGQRMDGLRGGWANSYLRGAYMRGIANAQEDLRQVGVKVPDEDVTYYSVHANALNKLYQQANEDLRHVEDMVVEQTVNKLTPALENERPSEELVALVDGRIQAVGMSRSRTLVNSLVVAAVATAVLNRLTDFGIRTVAAEIEYEFTTAGDEHVCPTCRGLATTDNGLGPGVYAVEQAYGVLPAHGGCRCTWRVRKQR